MKTQSAYLFILTLTTAFILSSCGSDRNNPGIQYAPEMYSSIPYEPFTQDIDSFAPFKDRRNQQIPPEGTIARGQFASYDIPNSEEDSIRHSDAVKNMINPLRRTSKTMEEGEVLYLRFCSACHGEKGAGDGKVAGHDAINPTAYNAGAVADYTAGEVYYVIMHGKGVMGSYASQLTYEDRWKVAHYVEKLQGKEMAPERDYFDAGMVNIADFKKKPEYEEVYALQNVEFGVGDASITAEGLKTLDMVSKFLKDNKELVNKQRLMIHFEGHTDSDGDTTVNMLLSEQRAQSVADYVIGKGASSSKIKAVGYGSSMPVARGEGDDFKARNRRTEVKIVKQKK